MRNLVTGGRAPKKGPGDTPVRWVAGLAADAKRKGTDSVFACPLLLRGI
jgi:hypothetical protein